MKRLLLFTLLLLNGISAFSQHCSNPIRIVVLGTSTAWGNGVPSRDSAWTFRLSRYLKTTHNPADTIILMAESGLTTHNIQAPGTPPYTVNGSTYNVSATRNIATAIAQAPHAIIISIPFEDESRGFPMSVTVANFLKLKQAAVQANIPLWVTTTQPRPNLGAAGGQRLRQMKDSILQYFGINAIDFFTGLAAADGSILAAYSANDGFHLNSAGQRILFDRVVAKQIPAALCSPGPVTPFQIASFNTERLEDKLKINWRTVAETKTLRFQLERSTDSVSWTTIATIAAAGNAAVPRDYTFTDPAIHAQPMYYRLNMEDSSNVHYFTAGIRGMPDVWYHTPFRLSAFAVGVAAGKLKLDWSTLTESNTVRFRIERSADSISWTEISTMAAAGNSTTARSYTYTDNNVSAGQTWFYRLNMEASLNRRSFSSTMKGTAPAIPQNCTTPLRIVVIGTSTAWGNGVPSRDSAWTFRLSRYLKTTHNQNDTIILMAESGLTTHNIQAVGTPAYTLNGTTYTVSATRNITTAIAQAPHAIIISIPYEDESRGFPMTVTVANLLKLKQAAAQANIPLWVTTTQPRQNLGVAGGLRLGQMKDSIMLHFGAKAIDFWTGLANSDGTIVTAYNANDGFHLNAAGQRILFDRVVNEQIPAVLCTPGPVTPFSIASFTTERLEDKLKVNWRTSAETKTLRFLLERSTDSLSWVSIATVTAAGNAATPRDYTFTDPIVHTQPVFYRLNMVDSSNVHYYTPGIKGIPDIWYHTPFRLSGFSVSVASGKLKLDWGTLTESNTVRFRIERSADSIGWSEIAAVSAAGSSSTARSYSYLDNSVTAGQNWFYRLNMEASLNRRSFSGVVKGTAPVTQPACTAPLRIVLLGSSTAWGNALPSRDSAWAFRYQRYLRAVHHPGDTIIILANGSFNTHHIMPDGTPPYTINGVTFSVESNYNISKAVSLQPDAILINMPTNDEGRGFPLTRQRDNYLTIKQVADAANIPVWIATPQPRGNLGYDAAIRLRYMRDTVFKYFGPRAMDFYNGLADPIGFIQPEYNTGDDVHLNAAAHALLAQRVISENIPDTICAIRNGTASLRMSHARVQETVLSEMPQGVLYPNPAKEYTILPRPAGESFNLEVYNAQGQTILRNPKATATRLAVSGWQPGVYIIILNGKHRYKLVKL